MMILITMQLIHSSEDKKKELNENGAIKLEYLGIMGYFVNQAFLNDYNLLSNDVEYKDLLINNYLVKEKLWEKAIKEYAKLQKHPECKQIIHGLHEPHEISDYCLPSKVEW